MKKYFYTSLIAASLLFSSCEEVIDLDLDQHEKRVVIDANLFVGETSYNKITLSYSSPFYTEGYQYISTASVQITNTTSNESYPFTYTSNGTYENNSFDPETDETYELEVIVEGKTYKAISKVWQAPEIEKIEQVNNGGFTGDMKEVQFYYRDDANTEDYYLSQIKDSEENNFFNGNDLFTNGNLISDSYTAEDEQQGETIFYGLAKIDKEYYNYLSKLFGNAASAGNPFATPTGTLKGNIINTTNENEFPLGYFHIAKRTTTSYTIQ